MSEILNQIANLAKAIKKQETDPEEIKYMEDFLLKRIETFPKYFSSVIMMKSQMAIASQLYDREKYIETIERLDQNRRNSHIMAAYAINQINRLCDTYNVNRIFKFPQINNRDLVPEAKIEGNTIMEKEAKDDRELAADAIYGFCKEVFLDKKTLERYNKINDFTREERDQELYEIGQSAGYFKTSTSIDELIKTAKEEVQVDSFTENSFEKNIEDRS